MSPYRIPLRMGMLNPQLPSANGTRQLFRANVNGKAINAIFYGVSPDEFHKISHVKTAKEAWTILQNNL